MSGPEARFNGVSGKSALIDALRSQPLLIRCADLTAPIAERGEILSVAPGQQIIEQGAWDTDLYFILAGGFDVFVNGQKVATRYAGEHVGEMAGLNVARARTATLIATTESAVLKIDQNNLREAVGENSTFWRSAADIVARRLEERNSRLGTPNDHPRVFLISSSEGLGVAERVQAELRSATLSVDLWNNGTFGISEYPLNDIEAAIEKSDFLIAIVRADDTLVSRGQTLLAARDNVHLEYGIGVGKLGKSRSILLVDASPELHLPSDLAGLTTARYRASDLTEMLRTTSIACDQIRSHILQVGVRKDRKN